MQRIGRNKHKVVFALCLLAMMSFVTCTRQQSVTVWEREKSASDFGDFDFSLLITNNYPELQPVIDHLDDSFRASHDPYAKGDIILFENRIKDAGDLYKAAGFYQDSSKHANTPLKEAIAALSLYSIEKLYGKEERRPQVIEQALAFEPWFGEVIKGKSNFSKQAITKTTAKKKPHLITIGSSSILLKKGGVVKCQSERVVRDWLSIYNLDLAPWDIENDRIVPWHEGARVKELVDFANAKVLPITGTIAKKQGDIWYAPDMEGVFKFEIVPDKVYNYPTNKIIDEQTVLIVDTHGISSIAWDAEGADIVVGCGDFTSKAEAAYYLAEKGINVYCPPDRFIYTLMGTETPGKVLGSAPIRQHPEGAIIGGQPITFSINEKIVVSTTTRGYPVQYYDTPYRYFKALEEYCGVSLNLEVFDIQEVGETANVVTLANEIEAKLIGVRVYNEEESKAVADWLRKDAGHRAVLFHSAPYPPGYQLFFEFPEQTSFGDIYPILE